MESIDYNRIPTITAEVLESTEKTAEVLGKVFAMADTHKDGYLNLREFHIFQQISMIAFGLLK